jgi:hypothetical protein
LKERFFFFFFLLSSFNLFPNEIQTKLATLKERVIMFATETKERKIQGLKGKIYSKRGLKGTRSFSE